MVALLDLLRPGCTVALSDGAGLPTMVLSELNESAAQLGGVGLLLGWSIGNLDALDPTAYGRVVTSMSGYALRPLIDDGRVGYLPVRMGALTALIRDVIRPDVLVASVVRNGDGHRFGSEVGWLRAAVEAGATIAGIERPALPGCDAGAPLPADQVVIIGSSSLPAIDLPRALPDEAQILIGRHVAALVPEGARIQFSPGAIGEAVCAAIEVPVRVDSGLLGDAIVDLDRRGLLVGEPSGAYLAGSPALYEWAADRPILHPVDVTHDPGRLAAAPGPFIAINTALEIDVDGQVNVERVGGTTIAGIGGHPDFSFAAATMPGGISIVALATHRGRHATLVDRLEGPTSTPGHDVDIVVTESGAADLRGLDRRERQAAIRDLWADELSG